MTAPKTRGEGQQTRRIASARRFGPGGRFELQPLQRRLLVDGEPAPLGARAFDLLLELAEQPGALRSKNELIEAVWPGVVVEEGNLATQISSLRKVLGGEVIVTIPGRGYRFAAALQAANGDTSAVAPVQPSAAAPPAAAKLRTNLPSELTPLLGRADDLAALGALIEQHRLVTVVGAGGMGKTLLAQHLLAERRHAYPHGVCFIALAQVRDADVLPAAIAAELGVQPGTGDPLAGLCAAVAPLTLLVVLDNAEQIVDGVAPVVAALRDAAPGLRMVVTSQAPLKLAAERVYRIGALALPYGPMPAAQACEFGAIALFVERAQATDERFVLTDANVPMVIDVCRQLDGMALAIELAAARAPMLGMQRLATSMHDRLKLLTAGRNREVPERHQTLRAALEWSHGFLDENERAVFRRLAVFVGSASLTLIQQVVADPPGEGDLDEWAVLDALTVLVDRSLVVLLGSDDAAEPRYRLLESSKVLALEQLQQAGEHEALRRRHAYAVAEWFDRAFDQPYRGDIGFEAWQLAMAPDLDNGREALAWASAADDPTRVLQIGATMFHALPLSIHAEHRALCDLCEPLIDRTDRLDLRVRAALGISVGLGNAQHGRALKVTRRALSNTSPAPASDADRWLRYRTLCRLAAAAHRNDVAAAEQAVEEARTVENSAWPPHRRRYRLQAESLVARARGDTTASLHLLRQSLPMDQAAGRSGSTTLVHLVDAELAAGDAAAAVRTGAALLETLGARDEYNRVAARFNLGAAWLAQNDTTQGRLVLRAGWEQAAYFELQHYFGDYLALLAALESRPEAAARLSGYADASNDRVGVREPNEAAAVERARALARAALGDAAFDRLHAEGMVLRDEQIATIAFGETGM